MAAISYAILSQGSDCLGKSLGKSDSKPYPKGKLSHQSINRGHPVMGPMAHGRCTGDRNLMQSRPQRMHLTLVRATALPSMAVPAAFGPALQVPARPLLRSSRPPGLTTHMPAALRFAGRPSRPRVPIPFWMHRRHPLQCSPLRARPTPSSGIPHLRHPPVQRSPLPLRRHSRIPTRGLISGSQSLT
jgi:hypothetical protein